MKIRPGYVIEVKDNVRGFKKNYAVVRLYLLGKFPLPWLRLVEWKSENIGVLNPESISLRILKDKNISWKYLFKLSVLND